MGKFNLGGALGSDLLNETSKAMRISQDFNVIPIDINLIDPSEDNEGMSLDDIEELAQSILDNGLDQNLVIIPADNGRYKCLSGHRRRLALLSLIEKGHNEFSNVPCLIKNIDDVKFNISQHGKEKFALLTTNIQRRNNTVADNLKLMQLADEVFEEMKQAGEPVGKRREWIAQTLGVSASTVRDLTAIDKKATEKVKQAIEEDKVPLTVATEIVQLPEEQQDKLIEEKKEETPLSVSDVKEFVEKETKKKIVASTEEKPKKSDVYAVGLEQDADEFINKLKAQKKIRKTAYLKKTDYDKVIIAQGIIFKQLEKIEKILRDNQAES